MKYVKLENNELIFSTNVESLEDGSVVFNPTPEILEQLGYKELVEEAPVQKDWYYQTPTYVETDKTIIRTWEYTKVDPPIEKRLIDKKIAEQLDTNDEFALINKGISNPNDPDYLNYRQFIEDCKFWALQQIEDYNNA